MGDSIMNILKASLGLGVWSLSEAITSGTGPGSAALIILCTCGLSCWTFALVGEACEAYEQARGTKGDARSCGDFRKVWAYCVGAKSAIIIDILLMAYALAVAVPYVITIRGLLSPLLGVAGCPQALLGVPLRIAVGLICLALSRLRLMKYLAITSLLGNIALLVTFAIMTLRLFDGSYAPGGLFVGEESGEVFDMWAVTSLTPVLAVRSTFSTSSHFTATKVFEQMKDRSAARVCYAAKVAYVTLFVFYTAASLCGVYTFPGRALVPVLNSYNYKDPIANLARWMNIVSNCGTFPFLFAAAEQSCGRLVEYFAEGVNSTDKAEDMGMAMLGVIISVLGMVLDDVGKCVTVAGAFFTATFVYILPVVMRLGMLRRHTGEKENSGGSVFQGCLLVTLMYGFLCVAYGMAHVAGY